METARAHPVFKHRKLREKIKNKGSPKAFASHDQENCSYSGSNFGNSGFGAARFTCTERSTSWFRTLGAREDSGERTRRGTPRGHGEGTEQDVRGESRETPKSASPPLALLLLEKVPIALVAGARLTWAMMRSVRSEPGLRGERERETVTRAPVPFPQKGPVPHPTPTVEEPLPGPPPLTEKVERRSAGEKRTDAHAEGQGTTLRGSVQRKRPSQPSPARPCPATPRHAPARPHTHQGPAPNYTTLQAPPCPRHWPHP